MPILSSDTVEFISRSPQQSHRLGVRLGALLSAGDVITLTGALGTGKTVLAQGIGKGWGASSRLISPTFVLIRRHTRPQDRQYLYHIDLYRLQSEMEVLGLGLEEILGAEDAVCVVEWPERAVNLFPAERLEVTLRWMDEFRRILTFRAMGEHHHELLSAFRKEIIGR